MELLATGEGVWVPWLGVNWLDSVQISKGVENVFWLGVGRVAFGGKRARGWGKLGARFVNGCRWMDLEQNKVRGYKGWG